jgi:proteasome alpha subunit
MSSPFYVSPEQWFLEKAEYARKGIARGKPIVALEYLDGIVLIAENSSATLRKTAEIYDRIAFAGVGKFDEYESLRKSGVRYADLKGYTFSRDDVAAKSLADEYSTLLGSIFTREAKAYEVEVLVVEVGNGVNGRGSSFYQVLYDGFIADHSHYAAIGGDAEDLREALRADWKESLSLADAVRLGCRALSRGTSGSQSLNESNLEVSVLERSRPGRKFRRLTPDEVRELVSG